MAILQSGVAHVRDTEQFVIKSNFWVVLLRFLGKSNTRTLKYAVTVWCVSRWKSNRLVNHILRGHPCFQRASIHIQKPLYSNSCTTCRRSLTKTSSGGCGFSATSPSVLASSRREAMFITELVSPPPWKAALTPLHGFEPARKRRHPGEGLYVSAPLAP